MIQKLAGRHFNLYTGHVIVWQGFLVNLVVRFKSTHYVFSETCLLVVKTNFNFV